MFQLFGVLTLGALLAFLLEIADEGEDVAEVVGEFEFLFSGDACGGLRDGYTEARPAVIFAEEDHPGCFQAGDGIGVEGFGYTFIAREISNPEASINRLLLESDGFALIMVGRTVTRGISVGIASFVNGHHIALRVAYVEFGGFSLFRFIIVAIKSLFVDIITNELSIYYNPCPN